MSAQITEQKILDALKSVQMPGQNRDILTAEAVSNIVVKDGNVGFTIEISPEQAGAADALKADAENAVNACLLYTSPSPRDLLGSRMPSSA